MPKVETHTETFDVHTETVKVPVAMLWNLALARVASGTPSLEAALLWAASELAFVGTDREVYGETDDLIVQFDEDGIVGQQGAGMCQITTTIRRTHWDLPDNF